MADINAVAEQFVGYYYQLLKSQHTRSTLVSELYRDSSMLTWQDSQCLGMAAIAEKLTTLPFEITDVKSPQIAAQPLPGGILVMVTGFLAIQDNEHEMPFSQTFGLMQDGPRYFVQNDLFRLNFG